MYEVPLTAEELDERLCNYCSTYDYGETKSSSHPDWGCIMCEGSHCDQAYEEYLESCETTQNVANYCNTVKLKNKKEVEEWLEL